MTHGYLKDPDRIYRASHDAILRETDLDRFTDDERAVAVRLVHACGMPDITRDLRFSPAAVSRGVAALRRGAPILCDCRMVASGVSLPPDGIRSRVICRLGDPGVPELARAGATTRSAAQVTLWRPDQRDAVVAIGNAPTALFRLLEEIEAGAPVPAIVLGFPVGFVGAAESKAALSGSCPRVPSATLLGRRGGSAMAAAAVNALARLAVGLPQ